MTLRTEAIRIIRDSKYGHSRSIHCSKLRFKDDLTVAITEPFEEMVSYRGHLHSPR